jgi:hypothetical protein
MSRVSYKKKKANLKPKRYAAIMNLQSLLHQFFLANSIPLHSIYRYRH